MNIQQKAQQGFTLIELMIVIAIIGILAAIALPAYQDYTVRAKMSEPIAALSEAKTAYTEYYSANGFLPENQSKSGIATARYGEYVNLITVSDNSEFIVATVPGGIIPGTGTTAQTIALSGASQVDGTIVWVCGKLAGTGNYVPTKYLPSTCRG